jgi:DNA-binding NarL/FixJ family response regulator
MNVITPPVADADLSQTTFLVVDDKPHFRDIAHAALVRCRARDVKHAPDADEAVQVLKRFGPHIGGIVCDWDIAPVGGLELLRAIRSGKYPRIARDLCAVILTGKPDAAVVKAAMALDVNGIAVAPLSVEKLSKTVSLAFQRGLKLREGEQYAAVALPSRQKIPEKAASAGVVAGPPQPRRSAASAAAASVVKPSELVNVRMCTLEQARAGVILARDLSDREGHLLLKAGNALSQSLLDRLTEVSGNHADSYHLWIGDRRPA